MKNILTKKLDTTLRVEKAIEFLLTHINDVKIDEFEKFCGVGVIVTPAQIEAVVEQLIKANKTELLAKRYKFNAGPLMQKVRGQLPWADGKAIKNEVDLQVCILQNSVISIYFRFFKILDILGPKTETDLLPTTKSDKKVKSTPIKPKQDDKLPKDINGNIFADSYIYLSIFN